MSFTKFPFKCPNPCPNRCADPNCHTTCKKYLDAVELHREQESKAYKALHAAMLHGAYCKEDKERRRRAHL